MQILWKPHKRQAEALSSIADEILYGGARGGGKTDAGLAWLLYWVHEPKYRALVIRQNAKDLSDWIDRARKMYQHVGAKFVGQPTEIRFPSGAVIRTGHLKDDNAYTQYQGHEYHKILIEELTKIPNEKQYEALLGSNRSTVDGLKPQVFCTTNPDGAGYEWVRERFDTQVADEKPRYYEDKRSGRTRTRIFIPAKVEDNPTLIEKDPDYIAYLNSIQDETLRKQWRDGSWDEPMIEGSYYAKWVDKAQEESRITSVPYESTVPVDTWWDLGMSDAMSLWFTQTVGEQIRVIDYFEAEGEGFNFYKNILSQKGYTYGAHYMPHDVEVRELGTGVSRKEKAQKLGITPILVVKKLNIPDGIEAVRTVLSRCWFDKEKCKAGLRSLKNYRKEWDEKRSVYKDRPVHDQYSHGADAFRYFAVGHAQYKTKVRKAPRQQFKHKTIYGI